MTRVAQLDWRQWRIVAAAAVTLTAASAMVAFAPFRRAISFGAVPVRPRTDVVPVADVIWAVELWARRMRWRTMCIEQGIAAQRLLRSRGIDARLHYGARHALDGGTLEAHVWVTVDGDAVIGGSQAPSFAEIASYP